MMTDKLIAVQQDVILGQLLDNTALLMQINTADDKVQTRQQVQMILVSVCFDRMQHQSASLGERNEHSRFVRLISVDRCS